MRFLPLTGTVAAAFLITLSPAAFAQDQTHKHGKTEAKATTETEHDHSEEHEHHHEAPHGGTLVVLGDEAAHLELVLDPARGHLTGYVLDAEAENAIRIPQSEITLQVFGRDVVSSASIPLKPVSSPLTGEKAGDTSQFEATSDALKGKKKFSVTVEDITIKGQNYKNTTSKFPEGNH